MIRPILETYYDLRRYIFPNRASAQPITPANTNSSRHRPLTYWNFGPSITPFLKPFFDAPHRQVHWSLENLAVHPAHQGQGHGRQLVDRVLQICQSDPVEDGGPPVCVIAANGKEGFYQKCGFGHLVGWLCKAVDDQGNDNPLRMNRVGGGAVLWTR